MRACFNQITAGRRAPERAAQDLPRDLGAVRRGGWEAIELWLRHWDGLVEAEGLAGARRVLDDAGLAAVGACAQPGLFFSRGETLRRHRDELARRLAQCQALGAPHLVITPGTPEDPGLPEQPSEAELGRAAENLRVAGEQAAAHGVRLGIEFLKMARFVNNLPTALRLAELVDHPDVGVVVDTFHLYAGLSKVEDLDRLRPARPAPRPAQPLPREGPPGGRQHLSFVHVNDVPETKPRELWTDADRVLPGEGAFPLPAIFAALRRAGYEGAVSLELFSEAFAARWAAEPEAAARLAYERTLPYLEAGG